MPLLLVCEDNDTGISVPTPDGWIACTFGNQPHLEYIAADGELDEVWDAVGAAIDHVRQHRRPAFLHLRTVRLWGHAGSDAEQAYRSLAEIEAVEARDPLLRNARRLVETGAADAGRAARSRARDARPGAWPSPRRQRAGRGCRPPRRSSHRWRPTIPERVAVRATTPA